MRTCKCIWCAKPNPHNGDRYCSTSCRQAMRVYVELLKAEKLDRLVWSVPS